MNGKLIFELLRKNQKIADLGSGLSGAWWWNSVKDNSTIDAFDLYNDTTQDTEDKKFYKLDVTKLKGNSSLKGKYDLIVADHIFEHVSNLNGLLESIKWISKSGTIIHIGIPDSSNFTDILYRLIHRFKSGGHIQKLTDKGIIKLMNSIGFELVSSEIWEDNWVWLEKLFSLKFNKVENVTQKEIQYLANVFRKELTLNKGYWYGFEFVFKRRN
jgi:predicted SAM-dependent methyltransferase